MVGAMHETINVRLRHARELAERLSARELDRLANRTEGHANLIEVDPEARPRVDVLTSYADVLGISLDWLVRGQGEAPRAEDVRAAVERARGAAPLATGTGG